VELWSEGGNEYGQGNEEGHDDVVQCLVEGGPRWSVVRDVDGIKSCQVKVHHVAGRNEDDAKRTRHRTTSTNPIRRDFVYQLFFFQSIVFKASSRPARHPHSPCRSTSSSRRGTRACKVPKRSRRTSPAGFCPSCTRPPPTPSCRRVKSRTSTLSLCRSFSQYTSPVGRDIPHCPARADCR
jgi:hypothetical protein